MDFIDRDAPPAAAGPPPSPVGEMSLQSLTLDPRGRVNEVQFLASHFDRLHGLVQGDEWRMGKSIGISMMGLPEFWSSPEPFSILSQVEYRDRIETGLDTARLLFERLTRWQRDQVPRDLVARLAQHLFLIDAAVDALH